MPSIRDLRHANNDIQRNIGIARGDYKDDLSSINKFGFNESVGTAYETIWEGSANYSYPATAGTVQLTADDSDDNGGTVLVQGLDANWDITQETLTIGGARGTQQFRRVYRMELLTANTGTVNVDTINAIHTQADSTDTTVAYLSAGAGQTLMCVYTVPRNYRAYLTRVTATVEKKDRDSRLRLLAKRNTDTEIFNVKGQWTSSGEKINITYTVPLVFGEMTDIELRGKMGSVATAMGGEFDLILEKIA
jgi:hypothetical protein